MKQKKISVESEKFTKELIGKIEDCKDLQDLLIAVCTSINTVQDVLSDGKLSFSDVFQIVSLSPIITDAIEGKENIVNELKAVKASSLIRQHESVKQYLKIKDPLTDAFMEFVIMGIVGGLAIASQKMQKA